MPEALVQFIGSIVDITFLVKLDAAKCLVNSF